MPLKRLMQSWLRKIEQRWDDRGRAAYDAVKDQDIDVIDLRLIRQNSEWSVTQIEKNSGNPIEQVLHPKYKGRGQG